MKASEVPTDVLLAHTSARDPFDSISRTTMAMVVDSGKYLAKRERDWKTEGYVKADGPVPSYRTSGMLAVVAMQSWGRSDDQPTEADLTEAVETVRQALAHDGVVMLDQKMHPRLRVALITGRVLHMTWAEYTAGLETRRQHRLKIEQQRDQARADEDAAHERLQALGLAGLPYSVRSLTWARLEELVDEAMALGADKTREA